MSCSRIPPQSMDAGSGTHRRFSHDEAIIACAVHAFARQHMAIGELKEIAAAIRRAMANPKYRGALDNAISGDGQCYLVSERWGDQSWEVSIIGGPHSPTKDKQTAQSFVRALEASASHIQEPNGFATIILLNTYMKGLQQ